MAVDEERQRLEREAESLLGDEGEEAQARLEDLYERCALQKPTWKCSYSFRELLACRRPPGRLHSALSAGLQ